MCRKIRRRLAVVRTATGLRAVRRFRTRRVLWTNALVRESCLLGPDSPNKLDPHMLNQRDLEEGAGRNIWFHRRVSLGEEGRLLLDAKYCPSCRPVPQDGDAQSALV